MKYLIKIKKINAEKHINYLTKNNIIYNIKTNENIIVFCFNNKNKKLIIKYLKNNNIDIISLKKIGLFSFISKQRAGLLLGGVVASVLWIISTFFVTNITIYGNNLYSISDIKNIVTSLYNSSIISKANVDTSKIEQAIISQTKINSVSCIIKGSTLVINIKEELPTEQFVEGNFSPIVSLYDGQVTSINLTQGTSAVSVGDIVKLGDILVYPFVTDSAGENKPVQPIASIVCDVWQTTTLDVYDNEIVTEKTGRVVEEKQISVFGKQIYKEQKTHDFKSFVVTEKQHYLSRFLLPIKVKTITYEETKQNTRVIDFEAQKQKYIENCKKIASLGLKKYDIIKTEDISIVEQPGKHTIVYVLTISKKIC